jgi:hypothetical protein
MRSRPAGGSIRSATEVQERGWGLQIGATVRCSDAHPAAGRAHTPFESWFIVRRVAWFGGATKGSKTLSG